jgi:hypothetical protein
MRRTRMAPLRMFLLVAAVLSISHGPPAAHHRATPLRGQSKGIVRGRVMDFNGAALVVPRPTIIFESRQVKKVVSPDEKGEYEIELPAGVYQVSAELRGFYPFRRAPFRMRSGAAVMINVIPTPRYLTRGTTVSNDRAVDVKADPPKYEEVHIPGLATEPSTVLVEFVKRRVRKRSVEYRGATLTYDVITVYADKIHLDRDTLRAQALGEYVIIEDGSQHVRVKRAEIEFRAGKPVIRATR